MPTMKKLTGRGNLLTTLFGNYTTSPFLKRSGGSTLHVYQRPLITFRYGISARVMEAKT